MTIRTLLAVSTVAVTLASFFLVLPAAVESRFNPVTATTPASESEHARTLHASLTIADLHADSLLWGRDLLIHSSRGQLDIPRLQQGNVALQVFSVVTKTPIGLNIEHNSDRTDEILALVLAERWPSRTWTSLTQRALYQAYRFHDMAARSGGTLVLIDTSDRLRDFLVRRKNDHRLVAGLLAIEGAQALDGDPANVDALYQAGYRMMSPSHFFDTEMGGSAHGELKGGLTEKGVEMIHRMEAGRMVLDLAHASGQTIDDALKIATRPVVVSHTGVKGTCNNNRNLSDAQLRAIAAKGGLIGIGFWETAVCGNDARAIAHAMRYTADLVGVDHVSHGSDFDGSVGTPFDTSDIARLTQALIDEGFSDDDIGRMMGGNEVRFLLDNLPPASPAMTLPHAAATS